MEGRTDGGTIEDGRIDEKRNGRKVEWIGGWKEETDVEGNGWCMNGERDRKMMEGWMNRGWKDGRKEGWTERGIVGEWKDRRRKGWLGVEGGADVERRMDIYHRGCVKDEKDEGRKGQTE